MPTIRTDDGIALNVTVTRPTAVSKAQDSVAATNTVVPSASGTVVLIAGYMAPSTTWLLQRDALAAAGYHVVCIDRRSHGRSDAPDHGHRIARHARDIDEVMTALDLSDAVLVGGSMGASTIWSYVDLFGTARVRGILSMDQTPRMLNADGWNLGYYGFDRTNAGTFFAEGIPSTGVGLGLERAIATLQLIGERVGPGENLMPQIRPETLPLLQDHALQDWRDVIARVEVPVLMVAGRQSQLWPAEHADVAAQLAKYGRAVVIDDCGHAVNLDQPDTFNSVLLDFVNEVTR